MGMFIILPMSSRLIQQCCSINSFKHRAMSRNKIDLCYRYCVC